MRSSCKYSSFGISEEVLALSCPIERLFRWDKFSPVGSFLTAFYMAFLNLLFVQDPWPLAAEFPASLSPFPYKLSYPSASSVRATAAREARMKLFLIIFIFLLENFKWTTNSIPFYTYWKSRTKF